VFEVSPVETDTQLPYRRSPRMKKKASKDKLLIKMSQELIAKKCGLLNEEKEMEDMTLQQYLDMYKQPLNEESLKAIEKLTEIDGGLKKKKKDKKKEKRVVKV
jgi:hypothetical protein